MTESEPPRCLICGYVLIGLPAGRCPECGTWFNPDNPATYSTKPLFDWWKFWLPGFVMAAGGGTLLYVLLILLTGWGWAVTLAAPFALGTAIGYGCRVRTLGNILLAIAGICVVVCTLYSLSLVGIFCGLVLAAVALVPVLVGASMGVLLRRRLKQSKFTQRWYLPTLMLAIVTGLGIVERIAHRPYSVECVTTSIEMPLAAGRAWNAVMFYEEVHHQPPWILRLGLPRPLYTRGSTAHVGDTKTCVYTRGHLTKRVTGREIGRRLAFDVTEQDGIENHSVRLTDGSFDFHPLGADRTRVELTTRYEPRLGPRWIWRPAEALAVHALHRHVLEGMRQKGMESP
jgi:hypothetical protein